jgi:hypothetical protein
VPITTSCLKTDSDSAVSWLKLLIGETLTLTGLGDVLIDVGSAHYRGTGILTPPQSQLYPVQMLRLERKSKNTLDGNPW